MVSKLRLYSNDSSSSAVHIATHTTIGGNLVFPDNAYDIGASGANRPKNIYAAGAITSGGNITAGDELITPRFVSHYGDPDTELDFQSDLLIIMAGGAEMVRFDENATPPEIVTFNLNGADHDFVVNADNVSPILHFITFVAS